MQDNFDISCEQPQPPLLDECLIVKKIFGQCRQQDCLRPVDDFTVVPSGVNYIKIGSSILCGTTAINNIENGTQALVGTINPGQIIAVNQGFTFNIKKDTFKVASIRIVNIGKSPFCQEGYWDVTIQYKFSYLLNILDSTGNIVSFTSGTSTIQDICACETYEKKLSLFGGENSCNEVTLADSLYGPQGTYSENVPYVQVQAIATPLKLVNGVYNAPGTTAPQCQCPLKYQADVTVGLFTVIKLYRMVSLVVQSPGYCDVPLCEAGQTGEACELFNSLPFPFDQFNPTQQG